MAQVKAQAKPSRSYGAIGTISCIVVALAIVFAFYSREPVAVSKKVSPSVEVPSADAKSLSPYNFHTLTVPSIDWPEDPEGAALLLKRLHNPGPDATPMLIRNSPCSSWAAFTKWSPEYLQQKFGAKELTFKAKRTDNLFVYAEDKPLDQVVPSIRTRFQAKKRQQSFEKMTMAKFWATALDPNATTVFYFSEALSSAPATAETQAAELSPDVQPFDVFVPAQNHFANLWLGSPGVVAQTHYDQDPNFAIQIRGHKRWILSPPSQALKLVPFPYLHSSYRQSMLNFTSGSLVDDISVEDAHSKGLVRDVVGSLEGTVAAFQVVAGPGNVLYLPPLWFHRVVTEDTSIAINMWTDRSGGDPLRTASEVPIPVEPYWSEGDKAQALSIFFADVAKLLPSVSVVGSSPIEKFGFDLLRRQYQFLYRDAPERKSESQLCRSIGGGVPRGLAEKAEYATQISRVAAELSRAQDPAAIQILFAAYIEMVIEVTLTPGKAAAFIRYCLAPE